MKKILSNLLTVVLLLTTLSTPVFADTTTGNMDDFKSIVESSELFEVYAGEVISLDVAVTSETDEGIRHTVSYTMSASNNNQRKLVFVGDSTYNYLVAAVINSSSNQLFIEDLLAGSGYSLRSSIDPNCSTYYCTKTETHYWNPQPGCSLIVGTTCDPLTGIPGYGLFLQLICKAGVFIYCNIDLTKKCVAGFWDNVCPM